MNSGRVPALELCNVCKTFGGLKATDNISIEVKEHEIYGIIGPNGVGKTTLFNLITGVVPLSSGQIKVFGQDISNLRADKICKVGVARTFQNIRLFNSATIMENLMIACQQTIQYSAIQGCLRTKQFRKEEHGAQERCRNILEKFGLLEYKDFTASKLPYGSQRRVEIMRALMTDPKVLLLDEPAAGMNPQETLELAEFIREIREKFHKTVLLIEHHMDLVMDIADRIYVLDFGELIAQGTPAEIQNNERVIDAYLGVAEDAED